jgi:hypothetical protein
MPTYAGYQAISTPDFSAPFREQMSGLMSKRAAEAAQASKTAMEQLKMEQAQNQKFKADWDKSISEISGKAVVDTPDKTVADMVYGNIDETGFYGVTGGVQMLLNLERSGLDQRELGFRIQNAKSDITNLHTYQTNLGKVSAEQKKMIDNEEAGFRMLYAVGDNEKKLNLNNKRLAWDDNMHMYLETFDPQTGETTRSESVRNLTSAYNIQDQFVKKADWGKWADETVKNAPSFTYTSGNKTITDPTKNKNWNGWINDQLDLATNAEDPERMVDILMDGQLSSSVELDNGVEFQVFGNAISDLNQMGDIYADALLKAERSKGELLTEEEANKIQSEIDKLTVAVTESGGKYKWHMDDVTKDFIRNELKERITQGVTIKQTKSGDGGGDLTKTQKIDKKVAQISNTAWNNRSKQKSVGEDDTKKIKNHASFEDLDKAYLYEYDPDINAVKIYRRTWTAGFETTLKSDPERIAYRAEDLSPFATSIARAQTSFEEGGGQSSTTGWDPNDYKKP